MENIYKVPPVIPRQSAEEEKIPIDYRFFSIPYDSSFEPAKGAPIRLKNYLPTPENYDKHLALGYGTYNTPLVKFYARQKIGREHALYLYLKHLSSQNSVPNTPLDNYYYNTSVSATDIYHNKKFNLESTLALRHNVFNWYGLPEDYISKADNIDPKQTLLRLNADEILHPTKGKISEVKVNFKTIFDGYDNSEFNVIGATCSKLAINEEQVNLDFSVNFVHSTFGQFEDDSKYNSVVLNAEPHISLKGDNLTLKAGVSIYYNNLAISKNQAFNIYPIVNASYQLIHDYIIPYGGVEGKRIQNTYNQFSLRNPFLNPRDITLTTTNQKLKIFFGVKGKILTNLNYDFKSYMEFINNQPLYKLSIPTLDDNYSYGNSFRVVYDTMNAFVGFFNLNWTNKERMSISWNMTLGSYNTETEASAWNIPNVKGALLFDYNINKKLKINSNIFFVGTRFDSYKKNTNTNAVEFKLSPYVDANVRLIYNIVSQLSMFVHLNNIFAQNYEKWALYRSQGAQLLIGASYKF